MRALLNSFKDQLEERLNNCEKQLESQAKESAEKIEQLHKRNNEVNYDQTSCLSVHVLQ